MKVLIFGAAGQDGYYLSRLCQSKGMDVIGIDTCGNDLHGDVADYAFVTQLIKYHTPHLIFHLAAQSTTRHEALFENHKIISTGTLNVLEAVRLHAPDTKVFLAQSGLQFKNSGNPITENDTFDATSPYAVARIQSVYASRYYRSLGIKVYNGYLFHHESPLRPPHHVSQMIARIVQQVAQGGNEKIEIGDIFVEKEWSFAGDIVAGMLALIEQDDIFEAVIGSGKAYSIKDWLEQCFGLIDKHWQEFVTVKYAYIPEYKKLVSNPETICSLGWLPQVSFSQLAEMMVFGVMDGCYVSDKKNITWSTSSKG